MSPLALSDSQLDAIMRAAAPLHPGDRDAFLRRVADRLRDRELGDGLVARICADEQRVLLRAPPSVEHPGKYSRRSSRFAFGAL